MPAASPGATRDRIIDAAMDLFAQRGFKAATTTEIERAAGLSPGAGGVFHHFPTKRDLLAAGIERRFQQVEALNKIRSAIPPLGDRRAELRLFAHFLVEQIDEERSLLAVVLNEARDHGDLVADTVRVLFTDRVAAFARWIVSLPADTEPDEDALALARMAIGALAYGPTIDLLLDRTTPPPTDAQIDRWVTATLALTDSPRRTP